GGAGAGGRAAATRRPAPLGTGPGEWGPPREGRRTGSDARATMLSMAATAMSDQPIDFDRLVVTFDRTQLGLGQFEVERGTVLDRGERIAADQQHDVLAVAHELLAELLDPVGDVHGVADHGEVDASGRADVADHDPPGMEPDAHADRRLAGRGARGAVPPYHHGPGERRP